MFSLRQRSFAEKLQIHFQKGDIGEKSVRILKKYRKHLKKGFFKTNIKIVDADQSIEPSKMDPEDDSDDIINRNIRNQKESYFKSLFIG